MPSTVTVHYPFHPLHGRCLEVVAWPRQPRLAVTVCQPDGQALKVPLWMVEPAAAHLLLLPGTKPYHPARGILEREKAMRGTLLNGHRIKPGPADSSIYDVIDGRSIADEMAGVGIKWQRANKGPGSRRNGWELLRKRLAASLKVKAGLPLEEPGMFVFDTCQHFIDTVPELPRLERDPEDVDTNAEDHIADETRYRLLAPKKEWASKRMEYV